MDSPEAIRVNFNIKIISRGKLMNCFIKFHHVSYHAVEC
jgi:hypothetical protein